MKKAKINLMFVVGWVLFSIMQIITHIVGALNNLLHFISGFAAGLMLAGTLMYFLPPKMKQWKLLFIRKKSK